ncbi:discoidin domain-containing protein [Alteromonas facilis]|uniref:discoidin domain-containing protein n=1 Tax=Alteromonas facilis TaxID=2048004 RepID=UPI000C28F7F7|nr:discoidin domain-containing protein [Alteromonas facilis]
MKALTAACLLSMLAASANAEEYQSIANEVEIGSDNYVNVKFITINEDDEPSCLEDGIYFPLNEPYASAWLDTMILARQSQQLVKFSYSAQDCSMSALTLLPLYSDNGGSYNNGPLEETGLNGNVALIGSNGLEESSISSSEYYNNDSAAAAFDGYVYSQQVNEESQGKIGRGIWLTKQWDSDNVRVNPWVEVDFGTVVTLSGLGIFINEQSLGLGRLPRTVSISSSNDGQTFTDTMEISLQNNASNTLALPEKLQGRFIKLQFVRNFGDPNYIEVDEIELYQ